MVNILTIPEYNLLITKINSHVHIWPDISYDSFAEILQYVPYFQYNLLAHVCTSFRDHLKHEKFWKQVCLKRFNITHLHNFSSYYEIYKRVCKFQNFGQTIRLNGIISTPIHVTKSTFGEFNTNYFNNQIRLKDEVTITHRSIFSELDTNYFEFNGRGENLEIRIEIIGDITKDLKTRATIFYGQESINCLLTMDLYRFCFHVKDSLGNTGFLDLYDSKTRNRIRLLSPKKSRCIIS